MEDFVAYPSRWRIGLIILGSIGFVIIGFWAIGAFGTPMVSRHSSPFGSELVGWASILFFGSGALLTIRKLFDVREALRIGPQGISSAQWSIPLIAWKEISGVKIWRHKGQKFIVLHLRNPGLFSSHRALRMANRALTGGDISISLTTTDRSFAEAMSAIERFRS